MKNLSRVLIFLICSLAVGYSQTSNVTATITDPDGQTWNNGTVQIHFIPTPGVPGPFTWTGGPIPILIKATMNASGLFTAAVPDNAFITPSGSKWQFTLCSNTSAPCQNVTTTVTGASPNLSSTLSTPLIAPRFATGQYAFGYLDVEVNVPVTTGSSYFNVTSLLLRQWTGSAWVNITGGGGSGGCIATVSTLVSHCGTVPGTLATVTDGANSSDCSIGGGTSKVACIYTGTQYVFAGSSNAGCIATASTLSSKCGTVTGTVASITDGASGTDCTVGGGTFKNVCVYNGTTWVSNGFPPANPNNTIQINSSGSFSSIPNVAAGSQLVSGSPPTFQVKPVCDTRDMAGADLGARIIACDTVLGGSQSASFNAPPGTIRVNSADAGAITSYPVFISSNHTLSLGPGVYTNGLGEFQPPILLGDFSSLICDSWQTVIQNSSNPTAAENIVIGTANATVGGSPNQANNAQIQTNGITVQGCHFTDSGLAHGTSLTGTVGLPNCHSCRVLNNWFDTIKTTAVALAGSSATHGFFGLDDEIAGNLITGTSNAGVSVIDNQDVRIHDNTFQNHGTGASAYIDIEPNLGTDWAFNINVHDNLFDCSAVPPAAAQCFGATVQTQLTNSTVFGNIVFHHNILLGPTTATTGYSVGGIEFGNPISHSAFNVDIDNNQLSFMYNLPGIQLQGTDRGWIHDNTILCSGLNPAITIGQFTTTSLVEHNHSYGTQGYCNGSGTLGREQLLTAIVDTDTTDSNNIIQDNTGSSYTVQFGTNSHIVNTQASGGGTDGSSQTFQIPTGFGSTIPGDIQITQLSAPSLNLLGFAYPPSVTCNSGTPTTYFWKITAVSQLGTEVASNEVTQIAGGANGCANLGWTYVPGAAGYKIYRSTTTGTEVYLNVQLPQGTLGYHDPLGQTTGGAVPTTNATGNFYVANNSTMAGALSLGGQLTSTVTIGTPPFIISSNTNVPNLNASLLLNNNWASPGTIGGSTPGQGIFSSLRDTGITGTVQCVSADSSGNFSGTGVPCSGGGGGGGTVTHTLGGLAANLWVVGNGNADLTTLDVAPNQYVDIPSSVAPGNPTSPNFRLWADTSGGLIKCLTSAGANCLPTGTVSSVGLTQTGSNFTITNTPIITSGNINIAFASQTQNLFLASPNGSTGVPVFRAIVGADVPPINLASSSNGGVIGNLPVANLNGGTNASASTVWCGNGTWCTAGAGNVTNAAQFSLATYTASGTANTIGGVAPPTTPPSVTQVWTSTPTSGGAAQAIVPLIPGISGRAVTGTTNSDIILPTDCNNRVEYTGSVAVAITLHTPTAMGVPFCVFRVVNRLSTLNNLTITPDAPLTCNGNATCVLSQGQLANLYVDPVGTNWQVDIQEQSQGAGTNITFTRSATGVSINGNAGTVTQVTVTSGMPALFNANFATNTTTPALSFTPIQPVANQLFGNPTGSTANGSYFGVTSPLAFASSALGCATCLFSSSAIANGDLVAGSGGAQGTASATAHNVSIPRACSDTSGSGTAQTCTTSPSFTLAAGDELVYTTTTANTGALTITANSVSMTVQKWQGSALVAGDIKANVPVLLVASDATHLQVQNIGNAPASGGTVTSVGFNINGGTAASGIFQAITGSPVTGSGTINVPISGNSGGLAYMSSSTVLSSSTSQTTHGLWLAEGAGNAPITTGVINAGQVLIGVASSDPTGSSTPTLGASGTAGTLAMFPSSGNFTTTLGSAATASNTVNFFATAPTNNDLIYCATSSTTCTLTDTGINRTVVVTTGGSNNFSSGGTINLSSATGANALQMPSQAGLTSNGTSSIGYDTTGKMMHVPTNGVDSLNVATTNVSNVTAQSTSQSAVTLATTPTAGQYHLSYYADQNALCTTGTNSVSFTFNWTDAGNARSSTTGNLPLLTAQSATSGFLSGELSIWVASGNVTYTSTVNGTCASGTSSYDVHVALSRVQ